MLCSKFAQKASNEIQISPRRAFFNESIQLHTKLRLNQQTYNQEQTRLFQISKDWSENANLILQINFLGDEGAIIKPSKREEDLKEVRQRLPSHQTAEEAVDQLQASEKLIAGKIFINF